MSAIYTVSLSFTYTAAGGDFDIAYTLAATGHPIRLLGFTIGQISEVGDAQEEGVRISVVRLPATVTASSGGSSITPTPVESGAPAANFTARAGDSVVATTSGTAATIAEYGWNERASPFVECYPDGRFSRIAPTAVAGEALVIRGQTTLADDATVQITAWIEES